MECQVEILKQHQHQEERKDKKLYDEAQFRNKLLQIGESLRPVVWSNAKCTARRSNIMQIKKDYDHSCSPFHGMFDHLNNCFISTSQVGGVLR